MLNLIDLEKRWLRYKIKSYIPHIAIATSSILIIILTFIILNLKDNTKKQVDKIVPIKKEKVAKITLLPKVKITKHKIETKQKSTIKKMELHPSFDFLKDIQSSSLPYYYDKQQAKKTSKIIEEKVTKEKVIVQEKPKKIKKHKIIIQRKETRNDINTIIQRFKKNNNPALSLFVAKKYYEIGNYHQSYNYALITNQINQDIEDSWIIFAKSLAKLGKRKKAMDTLKKYVKVSDSSNAQILLEEIASGKFK